MNKENHQNYDSVDDDGLNRESKGLYSDARLGFVRKVYLLISFQLFITCISAYLSMTSESYFMFQIQNLWLFFVLFILAFIVMIVLACFHKVGRTAPSNYMWWMIFNIAFSYCIGCICGLYSWSLDDTGKGLIVNQSGRMIVFIAATLTMMITLVLTLYAMTTKTQIDLCTAFFLILLVGLLVVIIMFVMFGGKIGHYALSLLFITLFGLFLAYDTQQICQPDNHYGITLDDFLIASIIIYMDIIQIFLQILKCLGRE